MSEDYKNFDAADEVDLAALKLSNVEFEVGKTYRVVNGEYWWGCDALNAGDEFKCTSIDSNGNYCWSQDVTFEGAKRPSVDLGWCVCGTSALRDGFIVEVDE